MAKSKLVYLHIEKSAGTSQRLLLWKLLHQNNVFWFGQDNIEAIHPAEPKSSYLAIGGHKKFGFYHQYRNKLLFTAVIREPIERVISLFNYDRKVIGGITSADGFDKKSIKNTLINCSIFRDKIYNTQCRYLSSKGNFLDTLDSINKHPFIIGNFENLEIYNAYLCSKLGLVPSPIPKANTGEENYSKLLGVDQEVIGLIEQYTQEDKKLYDYIATKEVFSSARENDWLKLRKELLARTKNLPNITILHLDKHSSLGINGTVLLENLHSKYNIIDSERISLFYEIDYLNNKKAQTKKKICNINFAANNEDSITVKFHISLEKSITKSCIFRVMVKEKSNITEDIKASRLVDEKFLFSWS